MEVQVLHRPPIITEVFRFVNREMDKIYWLLERVKTYRVLIGKDDMLDTAFEWKLKKLIALHDAVVEEGEALVNEMIEHYEALRKERKEWNESQVRVRNGK